LIISDPIQTFPLSLETFPLTTYTFYQTKGHVIIHGEGRTQMDIKPPFALQHQSDFIGHWKATTAISRLTAILKRILFGLILVLRKTRGLITLAAICAPVCILIGAANADECEPIETAYTVPQIPIRKIIPKDDIAIEFMLLKDFDVWVEYQNPFDDSRFVEGMVLEDWCTGTGYILEGNYWYLIGDEK
jgi:hypothetical protein